MKNLNTVSAILAVVALTACGSQTSRSVLSNGAQAANTSVVSTGTEDTSGNTNDLQAAPEQIITVSGNSGPYPTTSFRVSTDRTLKIKVTPQSAPNMTIPGYTNWVFPYGCVQLTVSVNGMTQTTQVLKVGSVQQGGTSACANAPTEQTLDFTNAMTGSGSALVSISNPQYDNCRAQWPLNYGCGMSAVWSNHLVRANITTQVDGTYMQ